MSGQTHAKGTDFTSTAGHFVIVYLYVPCQCQEPVHDVVPSVSLTAGDVRAHGLAAAHVLVGRVDAAGDRGAGPGRGGARLDRGAARRHGPPRPDPVDPGPDTPPAPGRTPFSLSTVLLSTLRIVRANFFVDLDDVVEISVEQQIGCREMSPLTEAAFFETTGFVR